VGRKRRKKNVKRGYETKAERNISQNKILYELIIAKRWEGGLRGLMIREGMWREF
jgi:hypothetical protein